jgi:hypothetical protein
MLRGCWCHIIVLNVHAPTEDETDDVKDSFYEELERVFYKFLKYHIQILLRNFVTKIGKELIYKPTIENESLHEISNNNGVRLANFDTFQISQSKVPCSNIATSINVLGRL